MEKGKQDFNKIIKEAREGSKVKQKLLYSYCKHLVYPMATNYLNYALKFGLNLQDLMDLLNETYYKLLTEKCSSYTNFDAYFRRKYEFDLLNILKQARSKKNLFFNEALKRSVFCDNGKYYINYEVVDESVTIEESLIKSNNFTRLKITLIPPSINGRDLNILEKYFSGYKVKEIASSIKISEYKVRKSLKTTMEVINKYHYSFSDLNIYRS